MAIPSRAIRQDDASGLNIRGFNISEAAETRLIQSVAISDPDDGTGADVVGEGMLPKGLTVYATDGTNAVIPRADAATKRLEVEVTEFPTGQGKTLAFAAISVASSGDNTIVAADGTRKIKVVSYVLVADAAVMVSWKSGSTLLSGAMSFAASGGVSAIGQPSAHILETGVNQPLILNLSGAVGVRGHLSYFLEA